MPENYVLQWDQTGEKIWETGIDHGVLYLQDAQGVYSNGYVWNGLTGVSESPSGGDNNAEYADNIKYANITSREDYAATINAFTYPEQFAECDGSAVIATGVYAGQQTRKPFGFSYRSKIGNDLLDDAYGYKIHLIYAAKASPSGKDYNTANESPELATFSWDVTTTSVEVPGNRPTAHVIIDSTKANATKLAALEQILYGTPATEAADAVYAQVPADAVFDGTKTYYTKDGTTYTEATGLASFANGTTYYTMTSPAVTASAAINPRLPLPAEVISLMS